MKYKDTKKMVRRAYHQGYVRATLTARYYALRYPSDDPIYRSIPDEEPEIVARMIDSVCMGCLEKVMDDWTSFDDRLRCNTVEELDQLSSQGGHLH